MLQLCISEGAQKVKEIMESGALKLPNNEATSNGRHSKLEVRHQQI